MKKTAKALLLVLCALILVVGSVFGTLAYLTSQAEVTNTFTVGKVSITLDEAVTNEYGVADGTRTTGETGNNYLLIPSHTYTKDPTIHVAAGSEECFLFVKVENGIAGIEIAEAAGDTVAEQLTANGWVLVDGTANIYYLDHTVAKNANSATDVVVFETFTVDPGVEQLNDDEAEDNTPDIAAYANAEIVVTAYAVQADGFSGSDHAEKAQAAWAATFGA